jgi:hypothetical protein
MNMLSKYCNADQTQIDCKVIETILGQIKKNTWFSVTLSQIFRGGRAGFFPIFTHFKNF